MSTQATATDFIGTWRLLDYSFIHDDGTVEKPWGPEVRGYLFYSAEGRMSANLSPSKDFHARRARLLTAALSTRHRPDRSQLARRSGRRDYIAYSGRYTVEGDTVIHHVEVSLFPNWIARPEVRFYQFEDDRLTLRTGPIKSGRHSITAQLIWQRVL